MTDPADVVTVPADGLPERLPCGVQLDDLLRQVAEGVPASDATHQRGCPHCRAALAELTDLWAPVHGMADEDVCAPASLTRTIMERVRPMATHGWHAVLTGTPGVTRIAAWVVAVIARRAAAGVPGVGSVRGQVTPPPVSVRSTSAEMVRDGPSRSQRAAAAGVGAVGRRVVIRVDVTAPPGISLPALAQEIRRRVTADVTTMTGLSVEAVDVFVSDLVDEVDDGPPAR
jgi:uncharacterized alkaline shock family protein YloU